MITDIYRSQTETGEAAKIGVQTEPQTSHTAGTPNSLPPAQPIPPRPRGILTIMIIISKALWVEAIKILDTLEAEVQNMEGDVKPTKLENQDRW